MSDLQIQDKPALERLRCGFVLAVPGEEGSAEEDRRDAADGGMQACPGFWKAETCGFAGSRQVLPESATNRLDEADNQGEHQQLEHSILQVDHDGCPGVLSSLRNEGNCQADRQECEDLPGIEGNVPQQP